MQIQDINVSVTATEPQTSDAQTADCYGFLLSRAREAAHKAYAPYSGFRVGAALLMDSGNVYAGSNQENAAYPSGLCAERTTLFYANAQEPDAKVMALMIYAENADGPVKIPITPCGACRQVLIEKENAQGAPMEILLAGCDSMLRVRSAADLMPISFLSKSMSGQ